MRLWILRPVDGLDINDNPWEPWYDKSFGFVVRADDELSARQLAHEHAGDENRGEFLGRVIAQTKSPWLDTKYSTCDKLEYAGEPEIVMRDFESA